MLEQRINEYLDTRKFMSGDPEDTLRAYRSGLTKLAKHMKSLKLADWSHVRRDHVVDWMASMAGLAANSRKQRLSLARTFFRWMIGQGYATVDPTLDVKGPKNQRTLHAVLSEADVAKMLRATEGPTDRDIRARSIIEFQYSTGCRIGEMHSLDLDQMNLHEGYAVVDGKGRKQRLVHLGLPAKDAMKRWLSRRKAFIKDRSLGEVGDAVWISFSPAAPGQRLSKRTMNLEIQEYAKRAGIEGVTSHELRHACASHLLAHGASLRDIQEILGHESAASTAIYTTVSDDSVRESFRHHHPRGGTDELFADRFKPMWERVRRKAACALQVAKKIGRPNQVFKPDLDAWARGEDEPPRSSWLDIITVTAGFMDD